MQDQAAGLRRLLGKAPLRAVALAGDGATTLAASLADALAAGGMDVLVIDENANNGNVADQLGVNTRLELMHVLSGERTLRDVICESESGVRVLSAARGARELQRDAGHGMSERLREAGIIPDLLLIDSASGGVSRLMQQPARCDSVIVAGAAHDSITAAYGLIKNAVRDFGDSRFQIVINRARNAAEAEAIFLNMSAVARKHAGARLEFLGWLPNDAQVRQARAMRSSVVAAFPTGAAAVAARSLAERLKNRSHGDEPEDMISAAIPFSGGGHEPALAGAAVGLIESMQKMSLQNTQRQTAAAAF
jgi:flagellar biosynthesis protein FlhG